MSAVEQPAPDDPVVEAPPVDPIFAMEQAVLGSVMCRNERYWECARAGLQAEHFGSELHAELWDEIGALVGVGMEASPLTLRVKFADHPALRNDNAARYLARLAVQSGAIIKPGDYARELRKEAARRFVVALCSEMRMAMLDRRNDVTDVILDAHARLDTCMPTPASGGLRPFAEGIDQALASNQRARERGAMDGVPFGLAALDQLVGAGKTDLVILAGRPGMGKSALAAHMAIHNAKAGRRVAFFSQEMSHEQLANREIASAANVAADLLRRGQTSDSQHAAQHQAAEQLRLLPLFVDEMGAIDPITLRAQLKRLMAAGPLDLVLIDYLQLMRPNYETENRVQDISAITAALKALAKELGVPIVALSQLNRGVEARENKRPLLADLRDSGSIEQDADMVIFVYRDYIYLTNAEPRDRASDAYRRWESEMAVAIERSELIVAKNRHGPCDKVVVGFIGPLMRFYDL